MLCWPQTFFFVTKLMRPCYFEIFCMFCYWEQNNQNAILSSSVVPFKRIPIKCNQYSYMYSIKEIALTVTCRHILNWLKVLLWLCQMYFWDKYLSFLQTCQVLQALPNLLIQSQMVKGVFGTVGHSLLRGHSQLRGHSLLGPHLVELEVYLTETKQQIQQI